MTSPLQVIDRDQALEARIEIEYERMEKAYADGDPHKAREHFRELGRLCGLRSREFVERREREMGLK